MRTCDARIAGLQIRRKVSLARPYVDQRADADVARLATGALSVEQRDDVVGTAEVVVAADAASQPHPAVHRRRHQYDVTRPGARRVEVFGQAVFANLCG